MIARTTLPFSLFIAILATACGAGAPDRAAAPPAAAGPPTVYTVGRSLLGVSDQAIDLAEAPVAPLAGWLTPAAVPSPDGRYVAYNAWHVIREDDPALSWADQGISPGDRLATPSIRLYDAEAGTDEAFANGAFSLAWRRDGAIAYFQGEDRDYRAGVSYRGQIVVRSSLEAPAQAWTSDPGRYIVAGWAGPTLLAYEEHEGEELDLLALDGPGRVRVLSPQAGLVAISPDGTEALVERGPETGAPSVQLLGVSAGTRLASLDLTTVDPAVGVVGYAGDWEGRLAVAPSASGLAVFRIDGRHIALAQAIRTGGDGVSEPRFAPGGVRLTGWTTTADGEAFVDCDRPSGRCRRVVPLPAARGVRGFPVWRRPVYNPSRPQEGVR